MKLSNIQVLLLRLVIAGLFLNAGMGKFQENWLTNSDHLLESLNNYHQRAAGAQLSYLDHVALPLASLWAKLITLGELCFAISLFLGLLVRLSSAVAIFMVINLHAANGTLFSWNFFGSPWAGLLVVGLLVLFLARAGRWAGLDALLATSNPSGKLW